MLIHPVNKIIDSNLWMLEVLQRFIYALIDLIALTLVWWNSVIFQWIVIFNGFYKMYLTLDRHNIKIQLLLPMKQTVLKSILVKLINIHLLLIILLLIFMQLAQVEQANGLLFLYNPQQPCNHFILVTIFLVLEDHEMIYYWFCQMKTSQLQIRFCWCI